MGIVLTWDSEVTLDLEVCPSSVRLFYGIELTDPPW